MLDKNTKRVYTFRERKSRGLQTAAAGPCLQKKSQNQRRKIIIKEAKKCPKKLRHHRP